MASIGQIIFYSMVTLIIIFSTLIILILALTFSRSSSQVMSSDTAPIANLGQDELLSCFLQTSMAQASLTQASVTWEKKDHGIVYRYTNGAPDLANQIAQFKGRAEVFPLGIITGNASLLLRNVVGDDDGVYTCTIGSSNGGGTVNINLRTAAFSAPRFTFSNDTLDARASRWFPKPNVTWSDRNERLLKGITSLTQDSAGIFSVDSTLQSANSSTTYNCKIENSLVAAVSEVTVTDFGVSGKTYFTFNAASSLLASTYLSIMTSVLSICHLT
ncbi:V-set domain-containing T-cell activation inhibitor 1 Precursor [Channa argus]|uniref:V-set domain-containing T-cell activation inhibitor 1 n=2 Tax=Channa argus TaxID=215402 RepID=A0A6G1PX28_CHAAH|nr:V-set domain-containing T-cell activation inhibitor 1 Precursor [Channa argus]